MVEVKLPDLLSEYSDKGYEVKPGIQFAGKIHGSDVKSGGSTYLEIFLQNSLDASVSCDIFIELPSRKLLKKTDLTTITNINVILDGTEVKKVVIPIQTSFKTPEGNYSIKIKLKGKGGKGGKKVRGAKELIDPNEAIGRSIVESALLSTVGLLLGGGITVRVYPSNDEFGASFTVKGRELGEDSYLLKCDEHILWTRSDTKFLTKATLWVKGHTEEWKNNLKLKNFCNLNFIEMLNNYFSIRNIELSDEEYLWLGNIFTTSTFHWGILKNIYNFPLYIYNHQGKLLWKYKLPRERNSELFNNLNFIEDILEPWFQIIKKDGNTGYISLISAIEAVHFEETTTKKVRYKEIPEVFKLFKECYSSHKTPEIFKYLSHIYFAAIFDAQNMFTQENELFEHLKLLESEINHNNYFELDEKKAIKSCISFVRRNILENKE